MKTPSLTPRFVTQALALALEGTDSETAFSSITTDSRKVQPGCLFVAIPGDTFDGHDFIDAALKAGARGVISRTERAPNDAPQGTWVFAVPDTIAAYRKLAHRWRREFRVPVIAVAGSVGKTTTKELLSAILLGKWKEVLKTQGSQNGFVGIPMTLLELRPYHGAAVIEVGIDEIGAMDQHMPLVSPTDAVLTALGPEHLEKLIDLPTVAREEAIALSWTAGKGGSVSVNLDDPWILPLWDKLETGNRTGFTLGSTDKRPALRGLLNEESRTLRMDGEGILREEFPLPLLGVHNARNLLAAITVARGLGLTPGEIRKGLESFQGAEGRSELRTLPGGGLVVCDYYNAQPVSMEAGLELLSASARGKTRFACLGDMLELGTLEEKLHRDLAKVLSRLGIENVLLYGPRMKWLADELKSSGFSGFFAHYASHAELYAALRSRMKPSDALIIKGSRGMKMEEVWKLVHAQG